MTDCIQFFDNDGMLVETFTAIAPKYKLVWFLNRTCAWYRLNKDCTYEKIGQGEYYLCLYQMLQDARRINSKKITLNWTHHKGLLKKAAETYPDMDSGKPMFLTIGGQVCFHMPIAVWKLVKCTEEMYAVYRQLEDGVWVQVYYDRLYACKRFMVDPESSVKESLVELYRSNKRLALYRYVANLSLYSTTSTFGWKPIATVVEEAINYTASWTTKAIRIGTEFIHIDGQHTTLVKPVETITDWNVTQLGYLSRLNRDEIAFLVEQGYISPVQTAPEIQEVVWRFLDDPERSLQLEYKRAMLEASKKE